MKFQSIETPDLQLRMRMNTKPKVKNAFLPVYLCEAE